MNRRAFLSISALIVASVTGFSFLSVEEQPIAEMLYFIDLSGGDTLYQTDFYPGLEKVEFECPNRSSSYDACALVRSRTDGQASISAVIPIAAGTINRYSFGKEAKGFPLYYMNGDAPVYVSFSGNSYLEDYMGFINAFSIDELSNPGADTVKVMSGFVSNLFDMNRKYPESKMVGFHLYALELQNYGKIIEAKLSKKYLRKWETLKKVDDGFFTREMKRVRDANLGLKCKSPGPETFLLQSSVYMVDEALLTDHVKVIVFWATWCGPCKPVMKQFADWNKELYTDEKVIFLGVTSESDTKMLFQWGAEHTEYDGLTIFQDTHLCMKTNYNIQQYPTILIFDKHDKLVVRDPGLERVKPIVDSLLQL
jgi:thiol-disulfide isomerase/thioredoxin